LLVDAKSPGNKTRHGRSTYKWIERREESREESRQIVCVCVCEREREKTRQWHNIPCNLNGGHQGAVSFRLIFFFLEPKFNRTHAPGEPHIEKRETKRRKKEEKKKKKKEEKLTVSA